MAPAARLVGREVDLGVLEGLGEIVERFRQLIRHVRHVLDSSTVGGGVQPLSEFTEFADILIVESRDEQFNLLTNVEGNFG